MKPFVVATDFSAAAEHALAHAASLAARLNVDLYVIHAWSPATVALLDMTLVEAPKDLARRTTDAQHKLDALVARFASDRLKVTGRLSDGEPAVVTATLAREVGAEMIFVGAHRASGLARLLGNTAEAIALAAPCPVVMVSGVGG